MRVYITEQLAVITVLLSPINSHVLSRRADPYCYTTGTRLDPSSLRGNIEEACKRLTAQGDIVVTEAGTRKIIWKSSETGIFVEVRLKGSGTLDRDGCNKVLNSIREACDNNGKVFRGGSAFVEGIKAELDPQSVVGGEVAGEASQNLKAMAKQNQERPQPQKSQQQQPPSQNQQNSPQPKAEDPPRQNQPSPNAPDEFAKTMLAIHSDYRALHNAPPLSWDEQIASDARSDSALCVYEHTSKGRYAQNIAMGSGRSLSGEDSVRMWYDEIKDYNFSTHQSVDPENKAIQIGHFTNIVWKGAVGLGCGIAFCPSHSFGGSRGATLVFCNYKSGGNGFNGGNEANVEPPIRRS